ncbi:NUDIX domain-containing protein [Candidatus Nomurabacteria bacterium]|nr:NUDIX domain-containing protein [Candidatus Nomurabacteria bacterium]
MSETVNTYSLDNTDFLVPMDRKAFYEEQTRVFKETGKPTKAVEIVNIMIFNSYGEIIIQKRSYEKAHNPGLLDKSIGGHVVHGDTVEYTVMVETVQELQTPSIVLKDFIDFNKTINILGSYLETIAIISTTKPIFYEPVKIINNEKIKIANKMHLFLGVYDGRIRPVDREAKGVLFYSLEELETEMKNQPNAFTDDLHEIIKLYKDEIVAFVELIKIKKSK